MEKQVKKGRFPIVQKEARQWYRRKTIRMREYQSANSRRILKIGRENDRMRSSIKGRLMLGKMYMFGYKPKLIDKLPYYDAFPCIFAIESHADGFLGINLHYLPHSSRAILMDGLYGLLTEETDDDLDFSVRSNEDIYKNTRLRLYNNGYNILEKSAKYSYFRPCIKKYLFKQATSRYMEIPYDEWEIALFLPLERFVGESKRKIWADTKRNYL